MQNHKIIPLTAMLPHSALMLGSTEPYEPGERSTTNAFRIPRFWSDAEADISNQCLAAGALWAILASIMISPNHLKAAGAAGGFVGGFGIEMIPARLAMTQRLSKSVGILFKSMVSNFAAYGIIGAIIQSELKKEQSLWGWTVGIGIIGAALSMIPYLARRYGDLNPVHNRMLDNMIATAGAAGIYGAGVAPKSNTGWVAILGLAFGGGLIGALPDAINKCRITHERHMGHYQTMVSNYFLLAIEVGLSIKDPMTKSVTSACSGLAAPLINAMISILEHLEYIGQRTAQALMEATTMGLLTALVFTTAAPEHPYMGAIGFAVGFMAIMAARFGSKHNVAEISPA